MAFLELNGMTIPTLKGGQVNHDVIGEQSRAFNGKLLSDRRIIKRRWSFTTKALGEMVAAEIIGMLNGEGHAWPFDFNDAARLTADLYSDKGVPSSPSNASIRYGTGADGDPVVDESSVGESKFGSGSLAGEVSTTNLLAANQRDVEGDTTGFAAIVGGVISVNTANRVQGLQSLRVITAAASDGARTTSVPASSSTAYAGSCYIKSESSRTILLRLRDDVAQIADSAVVIPADTWMRFEVTGTTDASATSIQLEILDLSPGGETIYIDAWQIEQNTTATSWADPSRSLVDLSYPATLLSGVSDFTFNFWIRTSSSMVSGDFPRVITLEETVGSFNRYDVRFRESSGVFEWSTEPVGLSADVLTHVPPGGFDDSWHMFTLVWRVNPESGEVGKRLYYDGVSQASSTPSGVLDLDAMATFEVANHLSAVLSKADMLLDDLQFLPWAATQAQITAWFNATTAAASKTLRATGDFIRESSLTVRGKVMPSSFVAFSDAGTWRANAKQVQFELWEV